MKMVFFISMAMAALASLVIYLYFIIWWKPEKMRETLRKQGIRGPKPCFLFGNTLEMKKMKEQISGSKSSDQGILDEFMSRLFPYFDVWRNEYGSTFVYSTGNIATLYVSDPNMVKEMSMCNSVDLGRPTSLSRECGALFGEGVIAANGSVWARQRKIIASHFFMGNTEGMLGIMEESTLSMIDLWRKKIEADGGILDMRVDEDLRNFSADVISKACFGSSYEKGKEIFHNLRLLQHTMPVNVGIPGLRYIPTKSNRKVWKLNREVQGSIMNVAKQRQEDQAVCDNSDLLQTIIDETIANKMGQNVAKRFIIDNCKNIYFAGHETTATAASWVLILLAVNLEWQDRVRAEIAQVCGKNNPITPDILPKMKLLTMVIYETMRLYPPSPFNSREIFRDMELAGIRLLKGTNVWISAAELHRDSDIWGADAGEFNPERFADGISKACKGPHAYTPFGFGIRTCLGMNFAMVELKVLLSLIISNFSFSISPNYRHSPSYNMFLEPEHGAYLVLKVLRLK